MTSRANARQVATAAQETDPAVILKLGVECSSALMAGDMERWISLWSSDAILMQPAGPRLSGSAQIRAALQPVIDLFDTEMSILPENVQIVGDFAYAYGNYKVTLTPKEGGEPISDTGMFLAILEKEAEGSWKISVTCCNISQQPESFTRNYTPQHT